MNNFRLVARNTTFLVLSEVFIKIIGFFYFVFLARSLSVDIFGRYNLVTSVVTIFSFLPDIGIGLIVVREIAKKSQDIAILLGNTFILTCIMSVATVVVVMSFGFIAGFSQEVMILLLISSATLLFSQIRSIPLFYFDGVERMGYSAILKALNSLSFILFGTLGLLLGFGLAGIITGFLIGSIISFVITWIVFLAKKIRISFKIDKKIARHLIYNGLPLGVAAFSSIIYTSIDGIMLERMLSEKALGIYASASKFGPTLIQLLNVPFMVAVYPALSRLSRKSSSRFQKAILKSLGVVLLWSVPASIGVAIFAGIIPIIFGERYNPGVPILRVLIFFVPFASLSALLYKVLIVINKQNWYLLVSIVGVVLNITLNLILIPRMLIMGAAIAAVATQAILFATYFLLVRRYIYPIRKAKAANGVYIAKPQ